MKRHLILLTILLFAALTSLAQTSLPTNLKGVTIFSNGAQVTREKNVALNAGEQTVSFTGLSPYLDRNSLQVKAKGSVTVLGVSQRYIRPDSTMLSERLKAASRDIDVASRRLSELQAQRTVLKSQLQMVEANCNIGSRTAVTPLNDIKLLNKYYYEEMMDINKKLIALDTEEEKANADLARFNEIADSIAGIKLKRITVVDVKVDAKVQTSALFTLQYYVSGASWYPTYDVRSSKVDEPLQLTYKANIMQQTGEDWKDVNVTLSTANPNRSNVSPDLRTYWLDYGLAAPTYNFGLDNNQVSGTIYDAEDGSPLIGASVTVSGSQIGTISDVDGRYSITMPNGNRRLVASYIGYESQQATVTGNRKDFRLKPDVAMLQDVVVVGYGTSSKGGWLRRKSSNSAAVEMAEPTAAASDSTHHPFEQQARQRPAWPIRIAHHLRIQGCAQD